MSLFWPASTAYKPRLDQLFVPKPVHQQKPTMTTLPVPDLELPQGKTQADRPKLYLLDYGAGNVRSLANSIHKLGYDFEWVKDASDLEKAEVSVLSVIPPATRSSRHRAAETTFPGCRRIRSRHDITQRHGPPGTFAPIHPQRKALLWNLHRYAGAL